jgi:hypothetical protein
MINDNGGPGLIQNINDFDVNSLVDKQVFPVNSVFPLQCNVPVVPSNLENTLVSAQCRENSEYHNEVEYTQIQPNNSSQGQEVDIFFSYCREKGTLRKCAKCYTAEYCGRGCQKKHWKNIKRCVKVY